MTPSAASALEIFFPMPALDAVTSATLPLIPRSMAYSDTTTSSPSTVKLCGMSSDAHFI
ncbi:hypothetical protein D3C87_1914550 [compost metagenome]